MSTSLKILNEPLVYSKNITVFLDLNFFLSNKIFYHSIISPFQYKIAYPTPLVSTDTEVSSNRMSPLLPCPYTIKRFIYKPQGIDFLPKTQTKFDISKLRLFDLTEFIV